MSRRGSGPLLLLSEDTQRTSGRDAQEMNITAGKAIAQSVRTTLGPKGMDKMLLDSSGNVVVTNDGVTILSEMDIDHPAANMIVEVAETQENEVGDGTTTAVVLAGELLSQAQELTGQDIHPTTIANGYRRAASRANELLDDRAIEVDVDDVDTLEQVAITVMTGKSTADFSDELADIIVDAVRAVADEDGHVNLDDIVVKTSAGRPIDESEYIEGVLVGEEPRTQKMPDDVTDASIAILDTGIEVKETEIDTEISVENPEQYREFKEAEKESLRARVRALVDAGVDVLFAGDDIADGPAEELAKAGILAIEDVDDEELAQLRRVTGATLLTEPEDVTPDHLGSAGHVHVEEVAGDAEVFVEDTEATDTVTIILRGSTEGLLDEVERAVEDTLHALRVSLASGGVLGGGGAPETELALALRDYAESVGGREQLAVEAFADALEVVPRTLAENAGLDPIDSLVELRARHDGGDVHAGLDPETGEAIDMFDEGVVEPVPVKQQAVNSATESAVMILRIDDVISAN